MSVCATMYPSVSDEIHGDLVFGGRQHIPLASLSPEIARQTITLMSPSKTFNLAGLEFAFAIIPDMELRRRFEAARSGMVPVSNVTGIMLRLKQPIRRARLGLKISSAIWRRIGISSGTLSSNDCPVSP